MTDDKKRVLVTCGPIPARLDSVKYLTNMFKGGLAFRTANWLARDNDLEVTVLCWERADIPKNNADWKALATIKDVFEYYDWIVAHANDFDAFVFAAAVANLTPVKPYEGKFPSHLYKPGQEFDIKFMIAPRAIDAVKQLNPRACVIGYKLFDEPDDDKLVEIARHTLDDARANLIFANRPSEAKHKKIAVLPDGTSFETNFQEHLELIRRAVLQDYFRTEVTPLSKDLEADPDVREALAAVAMYEQTFEKYGTVAIPVAGRENMFATTSRGHRAGPVIVYGVDPDCRTVHASGKATLNAPALAAMVHGFPGHVIVHRHFNDPMADKALVDRLDQRYSLEMRYMFPRTISEYEHVRGFIRGGVDAVPCPGHGYLVALPIVPADWKRYNKLFPEKYFKPQASMLEAVRHFRENNQDVLEIGGNLKPVGNYSYDPFVEPDPDFAKPVDWDGVMGRNWPCTVCFNALNYLTMDEINYIAMRSGVFMANTFRQAPETRSTAKEYAVLDATDKSTPMVRHGLKLPDDTLMRHRFHAYTAEDFERIGLSCVPYGTSSMLVHKDAEPYIQEDAAGNKEKKEEDDV